MIEEVFLEITTKILLIVIRDIFDITSNYLPSLSLHRPRINHDQEWAAVRHMYVYAATQRSVVTRHVARTCVRATGDF